MSVFLVGRFCRQIVTHNSQIRNPFVLSLAQSFHLYPGRPSCVNPLANSMIQQISVSEDFFFKQASYLFLC